MASAACGGLVESAVVSDGSDAGENDESRSNRRSNVIERGVFWAVGGRVHKVFGWKQPRRKHLPDIDPALFIRCGDDVEGGKSKTERQSGRAAEQCHPRPAEQSR